jgi:chromosome segregation ATPase
MGEDKIKPADPQEAEKLIVRAINYIEETENVLEDNDFNERISDLTDRLEALRQKISALKDHRPIQEELTEIVAELKPIESAYSSRIYDCSGEIQKKAGSNAAWAALSMVTLGLVKKPKG